MTDHLLRSPSDLDAAVVRAVAGGAGVTPAGELLDGLAVSRRTTLDALAESGPVYGVTTGMGLHANLGVGAADRAAYQGHLMLARAVGAPPWLDRRTTRAALAVRLRTLLDPETGISPDLVVAVVALLGADLHPALPSRGNGAAGEIIPLAHLGDFLAGTGDGLAADGTLTPAEDLLAGAGLQPYRFGTKEGVAFLQGVPIAIARAVLLGDEARLLSAQHLVAAAGSISLARAPRDPFHPALARGDEVLAEVLAEVRGLAGEEEAPRMMQAPVSFRVVGPTHAHLLRSLSGLAAVVDRRLAGVSTSPALVEGRFLGTFGFDGFDLAASLDAVRLAVLRTAEVGTARLHRLLDARVTGLPPQLSPEPGREAGLVALHKRAVGLLHEVRRSAAPASVGATDTSLGQEDVQDFALEAASALQDALAVLRDVTACELLAGHQARLLDTTGPRGTERLQALLHKASEPLGESAEDRPFGRDVDSLTHVLRLGWAHDRLSDPPDG